MKKHKFNIFPEAKAEDFSRLLEDICENGFDSKQPIVIYEGEILDGWNRQRACDHFGIQPVYTTFEGTDAEAIAFVMRTNKRRNLNSGQWATVAVEAEAVMEAIAEAVEREKARKNAEEKQARDAGEVRKIISEPQNPDSNTTAHKAAELFNTNMQYVKQAAKIKQVAPEVFEKVKAGTMTMQDANRALRAIPTSPWLDDETERRSKVEVDGECVVANQERDKNLIQWAESHRLALRVDRGSVYGNPFILGSDGDRDAVCDAYQTHYLPNKPSIQDAMWEWDSPRVLICHCYPERCHADSLAKAWNKGLSND
jgi:Domain of unknown function (DUF4326)